MRNSLDSIYWQRPQGSVLWKWEEMMISISTFRCCFFWTFFVFKFCALTVHTIVTCVDNFKNLIKQDQNKEFKMKTLRRIILWRVPTLFSIAMTTKLSMNLACLHYRKDTAHEKVATLFNIYLILAGRVLPYIREDIFILLGFGNFAAPPIQLHHMFSPWWPILTSCQHFTARFISTCLTLAAESWRRPSQLDAAAWKRGQGSLQVHSPADVYPCNRKFGANTCDITEILTQTDKSNFCSALQEVLETIWAFSGWNVVM